MTGPGPLADWRDSVSRYNVRDILGHFVKPRSERGDLCPHRCCQGRRVHPDKFPEILPRRMLRGMTDEELAEHFGKYAGNQKSGAQVLTEVHRRDVAKARRETNAKAANDRAYSRKLARYEEVDAAVLAAEHATGGQLVNKAGVRAGVSDRSLFEGSESRAIKYATPELIQYWQSNPRPSAGLRSSNPAVVRKARAGSNIGRVQHNYGKDRSSFYPGVY